MESNTISFVVYKHPMTTNGNKRTGTGGEYEGYQYKDGYKEEEDLDKEEGVVSGVSFFSEYRE